MPTRSFSMKQAGVSDRVIQAMVNKGRIRLTGPAPLSLA